MHSPVGDVTGSTHQAVNKTTAITVGHAAGLISFVYQRHGVTRLL